jgi:hypothetical protein
VRSIQKFFTHRPVSTFDRVSFQLTGELFLYGTTLPDGRSRSTTAAEARAKTHSSTRPAPTAHRNDVHSHDLRQRARARRRQGARRGRLARSPRAVGDGESSFASSRLGEDAVSETFDSRDATTRRDGAADALATRPRRRRARIDVSTSSRRVARFEAARVASRARRTGTTRRRSLRA